jgi:gentisate 1,2-dioxygenase
MVIGSDDAPGPSLLVGEATEDWTGEALFYEYSTAVDPLHIGAIGPVPTRQFSPEIHRGGPTRLIPLDLSDDLGVGYPATSPGLLASFVVLRPGDQLVTGADSTSELYYCIRGRGHSQIERSVATTGPGGATMKWAEGDFWTLPAGCTTVHAADPVESEEPEGALLYRVTDAPLLSYLGVTADTERFSPTKFDGAVARARLAEVERDPAALGRSRVSVLLASTATPQTLTVTHTLWAMLGVLPAGRVQRPHRHQSVALDLILECEPGCYSLVGTRLDPDGAIADPQRVDWEPAGAFVTPPGRWHSHHNESGHAAYLVPVQDAGLHTYLRSLDIRFAPSGD